MDVFFRKLTYLSSPVAGLRELSKKYINEGAMVNEHIYHLLVGDLVRWGDLTRAKIADSTIPVPGDLRILKTPDVSDLLFVLSNNQFISFQSPFFQGSRCAGQHGTHREKHRESELPSQLSKKKFDEKSVKCRPHNQLILPG